MTDELKLESERFVRLAAEAPKGKLTATEHLTWPGYSDVQPAMGDRCSLISTAYAELFAAAPDMAAHIAKLQAALDEALKDAGRYQWLRGNSNEYSLTEKDGYGGRQLKGWADLDAAIDAVMERQS